MVEWRMANGEFRKGIDSSFAISNSLFGWDRGREDRLPGLPDSCTRPSHRSVANHLTRPSIALSRCPSACWASCHWQVGASPLASQFAAAPGRLAFVILRTDSSPPVALHPASRRRSYLQLQAGERMPGGDLHPSDRVHSQAHWPTSLDVGEAMSACEQCWHLIIVCPTSKGDGPHRRR